MVPSMQHVLELCILHKSIASQDLFYFVRAETLAAERTRERYFLDQNDSNHVYLPRL